MSEKNTNQKKADDAIETATAHANQFNEGNADVIADCARAIVYALRDVATAIRETNKEE